MRTTLRAQVATVIFGLLLPSVAAAETITITSGQISLPGPFLPGPTTLAGTDGLVPFSVSGIVSSESSMDGFAACRPCEPGQTQTSIGLFASVVGDVTYGDESYSTGGGFSEMKGSLILQVFGNIILPAPPTAAGATMTISSPFSAGGFLSPPSVPGTGRQAFINGSGIAAVTLYGDPGDGRTPVWGVQSLEYRFGEQAPVPEPTSLLLLSSGLAALALKRRRRVPTAGIRRARTDRDS